MSKKHGKIQQENNKLIAEFLGYSQPHPDYPKSSYWYKKGENPLCFLSFNSDWNWLMSVIKKIGDETNYELVMGYDYCYWNNEGEQPLEDFEGGYGDIIYIYNAVVSFIKWYNANK